MLIDEDIWKIIDSTEFETNPVAKSIMQKLLKKSRVQKPLRVLFKADRRVIGYDLTKTVAR